MSAGLGLHPAPRDAVLYDDADGVKRVALIPPEQDAIQFLLDGLDVDSIKTLYELVERGRQAETADTILRWAEAGFPPWGCHNCRGAEYGPDGVACPACGGDSTSMEPPERARALLSSLVHNGLGHEPR